MNYRCKARVPSGKYEKNTSEAIPIMEEIEGHLVGFGIAYDDGQVTTALVIGDNSKLYEITSFEKNVYDIKPEFRRKHTKDMLVDDLLDKCIMFEEYSAYEINEEADRKLKILLRIKAVCKDR